MAMLVITRGYMQHIPAGNVQFPWRPLFLSTCIGRWFRSAFLHLSGEAKNIISVQLIFWGFTGIIMGFHGILVENHELYIYIHIHFGILTYGKSSAHKFPWLFKLLPRVCVEYSTMTPNSDKHAHKIKTNVSKCWRYILLIAIHCYYVYVYIYSNTQ